MQFFTFIKQKCEDLFSACSRFYSLVINYLGSFFGYQNDGYQTANVVNDDNAAQGTMVSQQQICVKAPGLFFAANVTPQRCISVSINTEQNDKEVILKLMSLYGLTQDTILYRAMTPYIFEQYSEVDVDCSDSYFLQANNSSCAIVQDIYSVSADKLKDIADCENVSRAAARKLGSTLNVSPDLNVVTGYGCDELQDSCIVSFKLGDVLKMGGKIYPDFGPIMGGAAFICTIPDGKIKVKLFRDTRTEYYNSMKFRWWPYNYPCLEFQLPFMSKSDIEKLINYVIKIDEDINNHNKNDINYDRMGFFTSEFMCGNDRLMVRLFNYKRNSDSDEKINKFIRMVVDFIDAFKNSAAQSASMSLKRNP